jgi:hypothetical protein
MSAPSQAVADRAVPVKDARAEAVPEVAGVWQGRSAAGCESPLRNSRCHAVNEVTFTLLQEGSTVSGFYKCAYGNTDCRKSNDIGRISNGSVGRKLLTMRIMMPDGSSCIFNGQPKTDKIEGGYLCLQGGGIVERGTWTALRSY